MNARVVLLLLHSRMPLHRILYPQCFVSIAAGLSNRSICDSPLMCVCVCVCPTTSLKTLQRKYSPAITSIAATGNVSALFNDNIALTFIEGEERKEKKKKSCIDRVETIAQNT